MVGSRVGKKQRSSVPVSVCPVTTGSVKAEVQHTQQTLKDLGQPAPLPVTVSGVQSSQEGLPRSKAASELWKMGQHMGRWKEQ